MFPAPTLTLSKLDNVLTVASETLSGFHSVVVGVWVRSGSHDESRPTSGISHFLEHLLFKGTLSRSAEQISLEVDSVGGDLDAFTERECTCYYLRCLPQHLRLGLDLLCDLVLHPAFQPEEFETEKQVVLQEIEQLRDNPADAVAELLSETMFPGQSFGLPILGYPEVVSSMERAVAQGFYQRAYRPQAMFITASGNFDPDLLLGELERHFPNANPSPQFSPPLTGMNASTDAPIYSPGHVTQFRDIGQAHVCMGLPAVTQHDDDKYPLSLVDIALGGGVSSRLFQEIREKRGLAYSVSSSLFPLAQVGTFGVQAATSPDDLDEVVDIVQTQFASLRSDGLAESELEKAKNQARGSLLMGLETPGSRMMALGRCLLYFDRVISVEETIQRLDHVSQEDTVRVSQRIFNDHAQAWALIAPQADRDPTHSLQRRFGQ